MNSITDANPRRCAECRAPEGRLVHRGRVNRRVWVETMNATGRGSHFYTEAMKVEFVPDAPVCTVCRMSPDAAAEPGRFW